MQEACFGETFWFGSPLHLLDDTYGLFGWRGEGGRIEGSKIELAKNKLILC